MEAYGHGWDEESGNGNNGNGKNGGKNGASVIRPIADGSLVVHRYHYQPTAGGGNNNNSHYNQYPAGGY
jgi:hypothetical protein